MQADTFAKFVIFIGAFYYYIVRPRRYALFLGRSLFFVTLLIPGFAHMVADWDHSQYSEEQTKTKNDVSVAVLIVSCMSAVPFSIAFDHRPSWRSIGKQLAAYLLGQCVLGAVLLWWQQDGVTVAHGKFVLWESPRIVMRYLCNLPWDGWGQLKELSGLLWEVFTDSVLKSLPGGAAAPTLALRHKDGRIVANITASL